MKIRYAEEIDYKDYEKQIQKMLATYVPAEEVIQVVEPVNIFEREAFRAEVDRVTSTRGKAEVIANRTKKTITEKMEEDPFFYRKFSLLLQQAIDDYKAQRISEAELLTKVTDIMDRVRDGSHDDTPAGVRDSDLAKAFYGALKEQVSGLAALPDQANEDPGSYGDKEGQGSDEQIASLLGQLACEIEAIIRRHAVVRWRENADAQNRMRNDLDDLLFTLQSQQGVKLTYAQMDSIRDHDALIFGQTRVGRLQPREPLAQFRIRRRRVNRLGQHRVLLGAQVRAVRRKVHLLVPTHELGHGFQTVDAVQLAEQLGIGGVVGHAASPHHRAAKRQRAGAQQALGRLIHPRAELSRVAGRCPQKQVRK